MTINYLGGFFLIVLGLVIIISKKNLIKIVIGMGLLDYGINLILISVGYRINGTAPIFLNGVKDNSVFVDPIPQALTLTSIVIGACVTTLSLAIVMKIKKYYNSINADEVRRLRG
ncbi:sodium:proton antiporter [Clostridium sardiniense]|uniref:Sodium:proton antiporter n=1 Tax=Clostridium sardiniense TaxID=29369 RepID=A0ABS7KZA6_CLOSR|nr:sodium:proton antiporter [Clostridium sardiniense]MBY0756151.1 sodium:proton antiporter [Clostridium sardiniense]MDQ0458906.1 multicomponent Na+:H+ antiporter subunit C [Clostridium sardiniense]